MSQIRDPTEFKVHDTSRGYESPGVPKIPRRPSISRMISEDEITTENSLPNRAPQSEENDVVDNTHNENIETNSTDQSDSESNSSLDSQYLDSFEDDVPGKIEQPRRPITTKPSFVNIPWMWIVFGTIATLIVSLALIDENPEQTIDISEIKSQFPKQNDELWLSFESGVKDVVTLNRPSTFIFIYEQKSENTVKSLISKLSTFAICNITKNCNKKPITLTISELNSPSVIEDYGILIDRYRENLKTNGVMIVKNLEKVRGISAQAFHTFCDEFTPLVEQSLFIFTMKVDKLPGKNRMKFIEDDLKTRWSEVDGDILVALITRITSMVVEIL